VAREGVLIRRKALRLMAKLQEAEVYRIKPDTDENVTVVFQCE
jgi:hypothetical protein